MDQAVINFKVYEDGNEHLGLASVVLPDLTYLTQSISGAGIAGNIEVPIIGHMDTMSTTINFRTTTKAAAKLAAPKRHQIELRAAQQEEDPVSGTIKVVPVKHVMVVLPKSNKGGTVQPASPTDGSGEYSVRYLKTVINGEVVTEIDPINFICVIDGVDYLADVRTALGN